MIEIGYVLPIGGGLIMLALSIAGMVFWLKMLVDCLKRDFKDKLLWGILLIFLSILAAVLYYFLVYKPEGKVKK